MSPSRWSKPAPALASGPAAGYNIPARSSGGRNLALVLCTGAALRRPSVWPVMRRKEGFRRLEHRQ